MMILLVRRLVYHNLRQSFAELYPLCRLLVCGLLIFILGDAKYWKGR